MALNLKAVFEVQDRGTAKLRKIAQQTEKLERATDKLSRSNRQLGSSSNRLGGAFRRVQNGLGDVVGGAGRVISALNPIGLAFAGVGAAAAGAYGAVKVFNATVGEAMKMEQSQVMIEAMFNDKKLASDYMKMMDRVAIKSPLLDSQQMYSNSKSFVALSKDSKQLEKMWSLTERLVASDPAQGLEGAVFALRELFSGDAISMIRRFEMDKSVMDSIKKMDLDGQLKALDKYLDKMGFTEKMISDMGNTALGKWTQVKERIQLIARDIGMPSVSVVSDFLDGMLSRLEGEDIQRFANWGASIMQSVVTGLSNSATKLYDWFTGLINSPEFQKITTITGKVDFVITDIAAKLQAWYDGGGNAKLQAFASIVVETLVGALSASEQFTAVGAQMGTSIVNGVISGVKTAASEYSIKDHLMNALKLSPAGLIYNTVKGSGGKETPHYHGLANVPYNGYSASLHKNERVLTAQENKEYTAAKEGKGGGLGGGVTITGNNFTIREEADIEKVAYKLALLIEKEATQIG